ncbi:MAG: hypothetical protein U1F87_11305 [Kiritimatiellia bacterium]
MNSTSKAVRWSSTLALGTLPLRSCSCVVVVTVRWPVVVPPPDWVVVLAGRVVVRGVETDVGAGAGVGTGVGVAPALKR